MPFTIPVHTVGARILQNFYSSDVVLMSQHLSAAGRWPNYSADKCCQWRSRTPQWGVVLHQISVSWVQHVTNNCTHSDLRFCENELSKRSKINEKGGQLD